MDGLYIKEDYQYNSEIFYPSLLKIHCERIKSEIQLESFVSAMLDKKRYVHIISYLRFSNLSIQESLISKKLRTNKRLYKFIYKFAYSILDSEKNGMLLLSNLKKSIIPISVFSVFPKYI